MREDFLPVFRELTSRYPGLIFWKHFERGIRGDGDIDTIVSKESVQEISDDFVRLSLESVEDVAGAVICHACENVIPHFLVLRSQYPDLFQFDISFNPIRLGAPWCEPTALSQFSEINHFKIRVLRPGAQAVVLFMLYGISPRGANSLREDDYADVLDGLRSDFATANACIAAILPPAISPIVKRCLRRLRLGVWPKGAVRLVWVAIATRSFGFHLVRGPVYWYRAAKKIAERDMAHHHSRRANVSNMADYFAASIKTNHRITRRELSVERGIGSQQLGG